VIVPAVLPEIVVGMRISLGVAWLVVVAAEMIALRSGLGYLIIDARNAGNRYDLVIAAMIIIGVIGLLLDVPDAPARRTQIGKVALWTLRSSSSQYRKGLRQGRKPPAGGGRHVLSLKTANSSPSSGRPAAASRR
jgi:hypothetical protein